MGSASFAATRNQVEGLYAVAYRFLEAGHVPHAIRAFRVMVRFAPTDERGWLGLGTCHEQLADDDVAEEIFGAGALVSEPRSARCLVALARLRAKDGDRRSALEILMEAQDLTEPESELQVAIEHARSVLS